MTDTSFPAASTAPQTPPTPEGMAYRLFQRDFGLSRGYALSVVKHLLTGMLDDSPERDAAVAAALSRSAAVAHAPAWRSMSEEPYDRPITARKRLDDGSWWYARVQAWHYEETDFTCYSLIHYNGEALLRGFRGPFDGWCEIDADVPAVAHGAPAGLVETDRYPLSASVWKRSPYPGCDDGEWVLEIEGTINDTYLTSRHTEPLSTRPEDVPGLPTLYAQVPDDAALAPGAKAGAVKSVESIADAFSKCEITVLEDDGFHKPKVVITFDDRAQAERALMSLDAHINRLVASGAAPAGGLSGVEAITEALYETDYVEGDDATGEWAIMVAGAIDGPFKRPAQEIVTKYRTRAAAMHARLSAAGTGDAGRPSTCKEGLQVAPTASEIAREQDAYRKGYEAAKALFGVPMPPATPATAPAGLPPRLGDPGYVSPASYSSFDGTYHGITLGSATAPAQAPAATGLRAGVEEAIQYLEIIAGRMEKSGSPEIARGIDVGVSGLRNHLAGLAAATDGSGATLRNQIRTLCSSVNGDAYLGKHAEEDLVAAIRQGIGDQFEPDAAPPTSAAEA